MLLTNQIVGFLKKQYLMSKVWEDLLLHANNCISFLKVDTAIFWGLGQACPDILSNCGVLTTEISQKKDLICRSSYMFYLFLCKRRR